MDCAARGTICSCARACAPARAEFRGRASRIDQYLGSSTAMPTSINLESRTNYRLSFPH